MKFDKGQQHAYPINESAPPKPREPKLDNMSNLFGMQDMIPAGNSTPPVRSNNE